MTITPGTLYLVGTPIGNLGDLSPRALETLSGVDFIAAEDTRVTGALLARFNIKKPLVSYYEHNLRQRGEQILARLEAGLPFVAVPGPSAVTTALALSGLDTGRFTFEGFLSTARKSRFEHLALLKNERRTMVFYEAPHKLKRTLADLLEAFGDREIALCREMTKLQEQVLRTTLSGAISHFEQTEPRGEFVLVVDGAPDTAAEDAAFTLDDAIALAQQYRADGHSASDAAKRAAAETGFRKGEIYRGLGQ